MTDSRPDNPQCPHVFDHPVTYADRQRLHEAVAYSRGIGDMAGLQIHLVRLGPCHAREQYLALLADAEEAAHADNIARDHGTGT